jgi:hypothetical protein
MRGTKPRGIVFIPVNPTHHALALEDCVSMSCGVTIILGTVGNTGSLYNVGTIARQ